MDAHREQKPADDALEAFLAGIALEQPDRDQILFVCIGTDRSTGDAFGPIIGTQLKEHGWRCVLGTLEQPCDAHSLETSVRDTMLPEGSERLTIIAIDACLGKPQSIGQYILSEGPLLPGAATGRRLPPIGHYSIAGVVNQIGPKAYWMLQTTSLHLVLQMAGRLVTAINNAWP